MPSKIVKTATSCAERISVLHLLHPIPTEPFKNPVPSWVDSTTNSYHLSFEKEKILASTLAFLSCTKQDYSRVTALCVAQVDGEDELEVLLAANKATWGDNEGFLEAVTGKFEGIFKTMSEPLKSGAQASIFNQILEICSRRIQERLRLVGTSRNQQSIKTTLDRAMEAPNQLDDFKKMAKRIKKAIGKWEDHRDPERLKKIVEAVHDLSKLDGLHAFVRSIPPQYLERSSGASLINIIMKVARYKEASWLLCDIAKRFPACRHMSVLPVNLPESFFQRVPAPTEAFELSPLLQQLGAANIKGKKGKGKATSEICRLLDISEEQANNSITEKRNDNLESAKIHAEVQLVYFIQSLPDTYIRPRVICSNKDACAMCNAFLQSQGKFYTPKCHGKLYPKWRLPASTGFRGLESTFIEALGRYIKDSVKLTIERQERIFYPDPNESTILTINWSSSCLVLSSSQGVTNQTSEQTTEALQDLQTVQSQAETALIEIEEDSTGQANPAPADSVPKNDELKDGHGREEKTIQNDDDARQRNTTQIQIDALQQVTGARKSQNKGTSLAPLDTAVRKATELAHPSRSLSPVPELEQKAEVSAASSDPSSKSSSELIEDTKLVHGVTKTLFVKPGQSTKLYQAWPMELQIEHAKKEDPYASSPAQDVRCSMTWLDGDRSVEILEGTGDVTIVDASTAAVEEIHISRDTLETHGVYIVFKRIVPYAF